MHVVRYLLMAAFLGAAVFTLVAPYMPKNEGETLVVGIFPRNHATMIKQQFSPLAQYMSHQLGRRVRIVAADSFPEFWEGVVKKKYHIVHFNQYHYISSKNKFGYEVVAMNEEDGRGSMTGTIVVRKDSGIDKVEDLRGRKIIFGGGPKAMQSYIYARYLLQQGGLKNEDFITEFAVNPPSAVVSTFYGLSNAAAAGAGDGILNMVGKQIDASEMKVLAQGEQYAQLPWAVRTDLSESLKNEIRGILIGLKDSDRGRRILSRAKLTGLLPAKDTDFDPYRKIVASVLGEKY